MWRGGWRGGVKGFINEKGERANECHTQTSGDPLITPTPDTQ